MTKNKKTQSRNATIKSKRDDYGNFKTETFNREGDVQSISVTTDQNNSTRFFVDLSQNESYVFDGRTARTIYRVLQKHYQFTDKNW